ncbi:hypothetical protein U3516DRAFT_735004 [Neocallimastix sp. 'constans']
MMLVENSQQLNKRLVENSQQLNKRLVENSQQLNKRLVENSQQLNKRLLDKSLIENSQQEAKIYRIFFSKNLKFNSTTHKNNNTQHISEHLNIFLKPLPIRVKMINEITDSKLDILETINKEIEIAIINQETFKTKESIIVEISRSKLTKTNIFYKPISHYYDYLLDFNKRDDIFVMHFKLQSP